MKCVSVGEELQDRSAWESKRPVCEVALVVDAHFQLDKLDSRALRVDIRKTTVSVAAIADLIAMKRAAGRPRDVEDIEALLHLQEANGKRSE